ncbi:radical SAM protein [Exiguobacterium sp. ERU656]|uniref:biotin synthase BioB n=1 Tax=Exiguobacterium sp. ERU656 TaxID=2751217 RepID=UPI001BE643BF|nr:radical SAM protein [Exiguobacterium sp. ERU656]
MNKEEIVKALNYSGAQQEELFKKARLVRNKYYDQSAILRGVIEITNLCRVNCDYCPMRRDNSKNNKVYTLNDEVKILEAVKEIKKNGINIVFFQAGEVPGTTKLIGNIIPKIKEMYDNDVEILLNLGIKSKKEYQYLYDQGATSYILKHETSDSDLHLKLRHEPLEGRIQAIKDLIDIGFKVGTGMIVGLPGQTIDSIAEDILLAKELGVHMCSVSPFVPAPNTPLENVPNGSSEISLNAISIMRLVSPHWLIPSVSALEKNGTGGQKLGFNAGSNVMTINFTPTSESEKYLIYGKDRFVVKTQYARKLLESVNLKPRKSVFVTTGL